MFVNGINQNACITNMATIEARNAWIPILFLDIASSPKALTGLNYAAHQTSASYCAVALLYPR